MYQLRPMLPALPAEAGDPGLFEKGCRSAGKIEAERGIKMNILVLNGSPRHNVNTAAMVSAFAKGAQSAGHKVDIVEVCREEIKGCLACVLQNLSFMFPVGLLYFLVADLMNGGVPGEKIIFYIIGCAVCIGLILLTTYFQYNATYFATYTESGVRRITLAERLRKFRCSSFGKKDLPIPTAPSWPNAPGPYTHPRTPGN